MENNIPLGLLVDAEESYIRRDVLEIR